MLLAIDVGNTTTNFGIYNENALCANWRMGTDQERTSDEAGIMMTQFLQHAGLSPKDVSHVIICTVVPPVMHSLLNAIRKYLGREPVLVEPGVRTGINIRYENPREVGADKIVNAVAALKLYGGPVIIVDFGTATTFCAVSERNDYLGGVICPGIKISADALFEKASKLTRVEIAKPRHVIGRTMVTSMQSGLVHGFVGQVDHIVGLMKTEMVAEHLVSGSGEDIRVVATGGMARLIGAESSTIGEINPLLTLEGLRVIHEMNHEPAEKTK
jgi:type III pantothenate kinase